MTSLAPRIRRWMFAPLLFGFVGSICTHGSLIFALLFGARGSARAAGEDGQGGAGGTTIDISLATSTPEVVAPAEVATAPEPTKPLPTNDTDEAKEEKTMPAPTKPVSNSENANGNAAETSSGKLVGPTRIGFPNAAIDGDSVDGQRALLPAAAACSDPVAGRWEALKFAPRRGDWVHFTLAVHRGAGGVLWGSILSRTWSGSPMDRDPPGCMPGGIDLTVTMNASGHADGTGRISFGASHFSIVAMPCPTFGADYAPDNFTGVIDSSREEFQSVNNDGARDVNQPYVFRRTGCF